MAAHAMSVSAPGTRKPPVTGRTVTSPCGSSRRTRSTLTDNGSGTPTVTSTSIRPPRSRTSWNRGRLECRIASDTARQAAFVPSPPWTSTPIPNSRTHGFALTLHPRTLGCRAGHYSAGVSEPTGGGDDGASALGRPVVRDQLRTYTDLMLRSPRGVCSVLSIAGTLVAVRGKLALGVVEHPGAGELRLGLGGDCADSQHEHRRHADHSLYASHRDPSLGTGCLL